MAKLFANDTISSSYSEQLRREHHGSKWGSTGARYSGNDVERLLRERPYIKTVLDFGAGKGSMGEYIKELGFDVEWTNYDPGVPEYDELPNKKFDLVISTDVLEHVEPERLRDTIRVMSELAGKVLYSDIACYPTGKLFGDGPYKGQDLHLTVETPEWWREVFAYVCPLQEANYEWREKRSKGKSKQRCMMVHERV